MVKTSLRTALVSFSASVALLGTICYGMKDYFYQYYENCATVAANIANLQIAGWCIPWKHISICIIVALFFVYYKIRRWTRASSSPSRTVIGNGPVVVSGKTLLDIHTASQSIKELSKRLDSVEKTTHLVMKQLEAVTKCMAEILREGTFRTVNNNQDSGLTPETHL